MCDEELNELL